MGKSAFRFSLYVILGGKDSKEEGGRFRVLSRSFLYLPFAGKLRLRHLLRQSALPGKFRFFSSGSERTPFLRSQLLTPASFANSAVVTTLSEFSQPGICLYTIPRTRARPL